MTTTNGDKSRIVEHRDGVVDRVNARGVKLATDTDYKNFSKYADPPITPPRRGQHVTLGLDADGYVRDLVVDIGSGGSTGDRERIITRLSVLRSAATFCAGRALSSDVPSQDVLKIADARLTWIERED